MSYSVTVCGKGAFPAILLLSREAKASAVDITTSRGSPAEERTGGGSLEARLPGVIQHMGVDAQMFAIEMPRTPRCIGDAASEDEGLMAGTAYRITGYLSEPITKRNRFGPVHGPREWQAWPTVGGFTYVPPNFLGVYKGTGDLAGEWVRPGSVMIVAGSPLPVQAAIQSAEPPVAPTGGLVWRSRVAMAPTARIVDVDMLTIWQQVMMVMGLLVTVGLAILATISLEAIRRWGGNSSQRKVVSPEGHGDAADSGPSPPAHDPQEPTTDRRAPLGRGAAPTRGLVRRSSALTGLAILVGAAAAYRSYRRRPSKPSRTRSDAR